MLCLLVNLYLACPGHVLPNSYEIILPSVLLTELPLALPVVGAASAGSWGTTWRGTTWLRSWRTHLHAGCACTLSLA